MQCDLFTTSALLNGGEFKNYIHTHPLGVQPSFYARNALHHLEHPVKQAH